MSVEIACTSNSPGTRPTVCYDYEVSVIAVIATIQYERVSQ